MSVRVMCPNCSKVTEVADECRGQRVPCSHCEKTILIPEPDTPPKRGHRFTLVELLVVIAIIVTLLSLLQPSHSCVSKARLRYMSAYSISAIINAISEYETAHGHLPPAYIADKDGVPLLSWRVLILPYLYQYQSDVTYLGKPREKLQGECEELYGQFHLDEPWNSDHNKNLIRRMPPCYKDLLSKFQYHYDEQWNSFHNRRLHAKIEDVTGDPLSRDSDHWRTNYLTVRGEETLFPGAEGLKIDHAIDESAARILVVEASDDRAVIWTKPDDFEYDERNPLKGLIGLRLQPADCFVTGWADGSVHEVKALIEPEILAAMFTREGCKRADCEKYEKEWVRRRD